MQETKNPTSTADIKSASEILKRLSDNITSVIKGKDEVVRKLLIGFATGGHVLLEDYPGTGKTTLAKTLALSIDSGFTRVQFTPDLLPSDILGVSIFDPKDREFRLHKGPIFTNILLVDEINRTSPRTQSALLEAMAEKQVSIDGTLFKLDDLFFVIATQNPVDSHGTYPLPEAQMDRFAIHLSLGYVDVEDEVAILTDQDKGHPIDLIKPCTTVDDVIQLKKTVKEVYISDELKHYIVHIVHETRSSEGALLGASPRASLSLVLAAKTVAVFDGRDYVIPEDIQEMAVPIVAHRIVMDPQAKFSGVTARGIVENILSRLPVPV